MAWLELHTVLIRHRKTKRFARALSLRPVVAVGHLATLWANVLELAEDGDITKWSIEDIAEYAEFEGDPKKFYAALLNEKDGWIDEIDSKRLVHDWWDYAGRYLKAKYKTNNPERLEQIQALYSYPKDELKSDFGRPSNQYNQSNLSNQSIYVEVAKATFDHYCVVFNKNKDQYQYTPKRRHKIEQRARELFAITNDIEKTRELLFLAVTNRKNSKFHMGENPQGKKYTDLIDHIFRSQEYTEKLIFEERPAQTRRPEWMDDMLKQYKERLEKNG